MTTSVHDHSIRELTVDVRTRTIRLRTSYPEIAGPDFAEVLFEDVSAYVFHGDALGTILFEVEVVDALTLYREYLSEMQRQYAYGGGHAPWVRSESSAADFLSAGDVQGYRVTSSIGLDGAVWARRLSIRSVD